MSEAKSYVVENTESLWYKAKKHWAPLFLDQCQTKHESTFEFKNVLNTQVILGFKWLKLGMFISVIFPNQQPTVSQTYGHKEHCSV